MTNEQIIAELAALRAQNASLAAALAAKTSGNIWVKMSEKGGISVGGLGKFPVTLYEEQWDKLLAGETLAKIAACRETNRVALDAVKAAFQAKKAKAA